MSIEHEKREVYLAIHSVCVYILLEPNIIAALVYRRTQEGFDREIYEGLEAIIRLSETKGELNLSEAYSRGEFQPIDAEL